MSVIQGITDGYGAVIGQPEEDPGDISQIDFMTLLVAQIQNQDPTSPMDNQQFTEQITSFTMLDELTAVNEKLEENIMVSQSANNTAMLALVGKDVTVQGNDLSLSDGIATENVLNSQGPGQAVIKVLDENGRVVHSYAKTLDSGLNDITWDGTDGQGHSLPDGDYTLEATVTNGDVTVPFELLKTDAVEGLRYENNVAVVMVDNQEYYVSEIYKVS